MGNNIMTVVRILVSLGLMFSSAAYGACVERKEETAGNFFFCVSLLLVLVLGFLH